MSKFSCFYRPAMWVAVGLLTLSVSLAAEVSPAADACRQDLARRIKVAARDIEVVSCQARVFNDTSLGLPELDKMYAQVMTPGYTITLKAKNVSYLYNATDFRVRYAGSLDSLRYSALFVAKGDDNANLNGRLYQISLAGTNPRLLLEEASEFWPQANGSVLATLRTSRSGFALLHVALDGKLTRLDSAFAYTYATLNKDASQWAAFIRPGVGGGWQFAWAPVGETKGDPKVLDLPPGTAPIRISWQQERPLIEVKTMDGVAVYQMDEHAIMWDKSNAYLPPENGEVMLNKSETLVVKTETVDGAPVTRVVRQWFTGDEKPVATIRNFTVKHFTVSPEQRFLLVCGRNGNDQAQAFTVDLATGEVMATVREMQGPAALFLTPPADWLKFRTPGHPEAQ